MQELEKDNKCCLALGYFDSVHLGHRNLIAEAKKYASENGLIAAVATFSNNAYKQFNPDDKVVYTYRERLTVLDPLCDRVLPVRFDSRIKNMPAIEFLDALFAKYDIAATVCGYDYLFGAGAKGDAELLKSYCKEKGAECIVCDKFELDGMRVATTVVKELLLRGDIENANKYLGAPFFISGKVIPGRGAGRMFDIPTANIKLSSDKILPRSGVYAATCDIDGDTYEGAVNIGGRPTFGLSKIVAEMMIKDFSDNIYEKDITVYLHKYLRPVKKFDTPAELSAQVHKDIGWNEK